MSEIKEAKVVWKGDGLSFSSELGSGYRLDVGGPSGMPEVALASR